MIGSLNANIKEGIGAAAVADVLGKLGGLLISWDVFT
jgi:hypothetical protein